MKHSIPPTTYCDGCGIPEPPPDPADPLRRGHSPHRQVRLDGLGFGRHEVDLCRKCYDALVSLVGQHPAFPQRRDQFVEPQWLWTTTETEVDA